MTPIPSMPGYFADRDGRVYSTRRSDRLGYAEGELHELACPVSKKTGYATIRLCPVGRARVTRTVHSLIAETFLPPPGIGQVEIRHLDGNKQNCAVDNLRWGTRKENADDRRAHGHHAVGSAHPSAVLDELRVSGVKRRLFNGESYVDVARDEGVHRATIHNVKNGNSWAHVAWPQKED